MRIALICFDDMEELDLVGPWEVLRMWQLQYPDDGVDVFTASLDGETVTCAKGMKIVTDMAVTAVDDVDVLLMPGGRGTRSLIAREPVLDLVRLRSKAGTLMTSVCTGSLVYAAAGILADRPATTHWSALDLLARLDPTIDLRPDDRWVDSGEVVTASGVSAGIDMALHLIKRLHSEERARLVKKDIQYDPAPPV
ncbi:MAG TPA: DJ-1/PfpI family protein [Acidimicrobiia bacterium]|nr:DJ-1/PfpI family protein [Acidimicrobiia bacterium]